MNNKIYFHIDMDSFFVSCERAIRPDIKNVPIAISKNTKRSIATALSSDAKKLGAKVGEPIYVTKQKIPNLLVLEPRLDYYRSVSARIFELIATKFSKNIEVYSIDECYLDVSDVIQDYSSPIEYAKIIQDTIWNQLNIPCSIGISYNKFLAKMSTNLAKPHGIVFTEKEDIANNFYSLDIGDFFMIGRKSTQKLKAVNINTIGDFVYCQNTALLRSILGVNFYGFQQMAKGITVQSQEAKPTELKGIGQSTTFMQDDIFDEEHLKNVLLSLTKKVVNRLKIRNYLCSVVSVQVRNQDKSWNIFQRNIKVPTNNLEDIFKACFKLLKENWDGEPLRGIGLRVHNLISSQDNETPFSLFEQEKENDSKAIIDKINFSLGSKTLFTGQEHENMQNVRADQIKFSINDYDNNDLIDIDQSILKK
ncbi:Y-family DNA polymerase [Mycoplasma sp. 128]|uniref:Y-family DNA polymerase n=1 Tax=Mycoplasma sp. 3341 TaxID=3447506 RepID=UPI003F65941F